VIGDKLLPHLPTIVINRRIDDNVTNVLKSKYLVDFNSEEMRIGDLLWMQLVTGIVFSP
jgi:hypothetical protein